MAAYADTAVTLPAAPKRRRHATMGSLVLALVAAACSSESAGEDWTYAPVADAARTEAPGQDPARAPAASESGSPLAPPGRRDPLQPPAGVVIPRFVESERVDQPDAGDAIPAPGPGGPVAAPTSAPVRTSMPGASPMPTSVPVAEPTSRSQAGPQPAPSATAATATEVTLVAQDNSFDTGELTVSAGATVRLTLQNLDPIPHNFALYLSAAADQAVFVGETFSGPGASRTYEFVAPTEPGEYFFRCDVHPQLMTGTFIVE